MSVGQFVAERSGFCSFGGGEGEGRGEDGRNK